MAEPLSRARSTPAARGAGCCRHARAPARAEPRRDHGRAGRARLARGAAVPDGRQHLSQVAVLASIIAVAAVGEALVVITRNVDLSVEAMIGLVAYCVAVTLEQHALDAPGAIVVRARARARPRDDQRRHRDRLPGPGDRRDARHAEHLPRHRLPDRRQPPGPARRPPAGLHRCRPATRSSGIPIFVLVAVVVVVDRVGRPALDPVRAAALRGRQQPRGRRDPRHPVAPGRVHRLRPVRAAGRAWPACMWVIQFGTINGTSATGVVLAVVAAVVVGGVNIFGGSGTLVGAALGRALPRVHRERADPRRPVAVLAAGDLRRRDPGRGQRGRAHPATPPARRRREARPMSAAAAPAARRRSLDAPARALGDAARRRPDRADRRSATRCRRSS